MFAYTVSDDLVHPTLNPDRQSRSLPGCGLPSTIAFGNFDGVGKQDAFQVTPDGWWLVSFNSIGPWTAINFDPTRTPLASLRFGDFDGNGITDVLRTTGKVWQVSLGGRDPWQPLGLSKGVAASQVAVGKFDGDRYADIFYGDGSSHWWVQWGSSSGFGRAAVSGWQEVRTSAYPTAELSFGDFNGDGTTDVLAANGTIWEAAYSHPTRGRFTDWQPLNADPTEKNQFGTGGFDQDPLTDVFIATGKAWLMSSAARSVPRQLTPSTIPRSQTALADVTGGPGTDIIAFVP
jgi:hypothetical protein